MFTKRIPLKARFDAFVERAGIKDCWQWRGTPNSSGYGTIRMPGRRGKTMQAHRVAYILEFGPIPEGLCVCHRCDNRLCVNPNHLFTGTNKENIQDRDTKGRCKAKGLPGELCGRSKLKEKQVIAILNDPRNYSQIAKSYGVARTTIMRIKLGETWAFLRTLGK